MKATQGCLAEPAVWSRTSHCVGWFNFLTETNTTVLRLEMYPSHCMRALVPLLNCLLYCSEPAWDKDLSESAEGSFCELPLTCRCSFCPRAKNIALSLYPFTFRDQMIFTFLGRREQKREGALLWKQSVLMTKHPHYWVLRKDKITVCDVLVFLSSKIMKHLIRGRVYRNSHFWDSLYCLVAMDKSQDLKSPS